jgi:hypothetical protein
MVMRLERIKNPHENATSPPSRITLVLARFFVVIISKPLLCRLRAIEGKYEGIFLDDAHKKGPERPGQWTAMEALLGVTYARAASARAATVVGESARTVTLLDLVQSGDRLFMIGARVEARAVALTGQAAVAVATAANTVS